ncbi:hypothetical protein MCGE09_00555, partial [Thaumarchaeota archaeon SCGC AB-539-E09]
PPPPPSPVVIPPPIVDEGEDVVIDEYFQTKVRASVGSEVEVSFHVSWMSGGSVSGCLVEVNGTQCTTNSTGWAIYNASFGRVKAETYEVLNVLGDNIGDFVVNISTPVVIWDIVDLNLTVLSERVDVGATAVIDCSGAYRFDGARFNGTVAYNDTLTHGVVGQRNYVVSNITDMQFGLDVFDSNTVSVIFDSVDINLTIVEPRLDVGAEASLIWSGLYQYDHEPFYGEIEYSHALTSDVAQSVMFTVVNITDTKYGLKAFTSSSCECTWDRIEVTECGVDNSTVNVGEESIVWFKAVYANEDQVFDGESGVLMCNGTELEWSPVMERWERIVFSKVEGEKQYHVTGVEDLRYALSSFNSTEPVVVSFLVEPDEGGSEKAWSDLVGLAVIGVIVSGAVVASILYIQKRS